jgi:hypothetical protein
VKGSTPIRGDILWAGHHTTLAVDSSTGELRNLPGTEVQHVRHEPDLCLMRRRPPPVLLLPRL